ncbi:hypothetical protein SVAN01_02406 [Stagonosporopsis vannaccii]|nr:hypothetical protein SVAN01_02406 [Stagonosporopsis vannaccii]
MPPKAATGKTYSTDVMAAVLYVTGTTSLSMKHYEMMSSLDGTKTASAFQHDFRSVLAKAKELQARAKRGEKFEPVQPSTKRGNNKAFLSSAASILLILPSNLLFCIFLPKYPSSSPSKPTPPSSHIMGKAADSATSGQKTISVDCVAVLLMALGRTSISKEQLDMMSALDGTRTPSSFEHQFRPIIAQAKELKKRVEEGEKFTPVVAQKRGATALATSNKRKRDDIDDTPTKRAQPAPKPRANKAQPEHATASTSQPDNGEDELPDDMEAFIKSEKFWEEQYR